MLGVRPRFQGQFLKGLNRNGVEVIWGHWEGIRGGIRILCDLPPRDWQAGWQGCGLCSTAPFFVTIFVPGTAVVAFLRRGCFEEQRSVLLLLFDLFSFVLALYTSGLQGHTFHSQNDLKHKLFRFRFWISSWTRAVGMRTHTCHKYREITLSRLWWARAWPGVGRGRHHKVTLPGRLAQLVR